MPTPHIEANKEGVIAKTVIMPGDPLRAKFIAETFLENVTQFNAVRNMFGYTGEYKGKKISVMGSGMGMASIGIYSYELFEFYGVDNIIRVGSAGAYTKELNLYDIVLVTDAYSESTFGNIVLGEEVNTIGATTELNQKIKQSAIKLKTEININKIHSSDVFYRKNFKDFESINQEHDCTAVEMESFALFCNAKVTGKNAACLLTISDSLVTHAATTSQERQNSFTDMIKIALETEY